MNARCSTTRWTGSAPGRAPCWCSGAKRASARRPCCTTLARRADCRVAAIAGVESEFELPFAALHQLCGPMLGAVDALPEPQAQALQVAFGMAAGRVPDRFLVGLAVLSLLAEAAAERPLVCLVDDAQWLDEATCQVLGVAGRRMLAESVLLLFAVRETGRRAAVPRPAGADRRGARRRGCPGAARRGGARASWTIGCVTGWSPRPAGTRWRCWSWSGG